MRMFFFSRHTLSGAYRLSCVDSGLVPGAEVAAVKIFFFFNAILFFVPRDPFREVS